MTYLFPLVLTAHILVGLSVIGLVLLQHGKGADMGAAFGSGASGSLFGASGSANFLSRTTGVLAAVFFVTSLGLAYLANAKPAVSGSVMDAAVQSLPSSDSTAKPATESAANPAAPAPVPASNDSKAKDIPK